MALYADPPRADRMPDLVLSVGEHDVAHLPRSGHAVVFGDVAPLGALGVLVGDEIVWPTYPPRQGRHYDPRGAMEYLDDRGSVVQRDTTETMRETYAEHCRAEGVEAVDLDA